jgi:hypothetical protein
MGGRACCTPHMCPYCSLSISPSLTVTYTVTPSPPRYPLPLCPHAPMLLSFHAPMIPFIPLSSQTYSYLEPTLGRWHRAHHIHHHEHCKHSQSRDVPTPHNRSAHPPRRSTVRLRLRLLLSLSLFEYCYSSITDLFHNIHTSVYISGYPWY